MTEDVEPSVSDDLKPVVESDQEPSEQQAEGQPDEASEEKRRETAKERRERDKALKARLREEREQAIAAADAAEAKRMKILNAGKAEAAPVEADFADPLDYIAAKAVWSYSQKSVEKDASAAKEAADEARAAADKVAAQERSVIEAHWQAQIEDAKTRYSDFEAVLTRPDVVVTKQMADLIMESDVAADLAYRVNSQPELALAISKMSPIEAARTLGRLEAEITLPKPKTVTTSPDPVTPVKAAPSRNRSAANMSYDDYCKARAEGWSPTIG